MLFQQILRAKGKKLRWLHCVMRQNWMEVPDILRYCNENDIRLGPGGWRSGPAARLGHVLAG